MSAIATLKALLGLDNAQYKAGMRDSTGATAAFQKSLASAGRMIAAAFSVGAVVQMGRSLVSWASDASQAAQNAGILTADMIALNRVMIGAGLGVNEAEKMLAKLQNELFAAAGGSAESAKKFDALGLSVSDMAKLDPISMFQAVSRAAFATATPLQLLSDLFGDKLGPKAITALRDIAENGLPAVDAALGVTADAIESAGDQWDAFRDRAKGATVSIIAKLTEAGGVLAAFWRGYTGLKDEGNNLGFMDALRAKRDAGFKAVGDRAAAMRDEKAAKGAARSDFAAQQAKELAARIEKTSADAKAKADQKTKELQANAQDQIARLNERQASASYRSAPRGDSMASVGGFVGPQRGGLGQADRQLQLGMDQKRIAEETQRIMSKLADDVADIAAGLVGGP